ncbi:hypothetical protein J4429_04295 [Candidatus Pacearchaeota archaeon]|nr:hypothetical protein [Candidatus Pacearchaeota archaeon]
MKIKNIMTREEQAKKTKRNQLIIGILLILLMAMSTVGYALSTRENKDNVNNKFRYNGIDFIKNSEYWYFNSNGQEFATRYNPKETENISVGFLYLKLNDYLNEPLYFVGNFPDANYELKRNLYPFASRIQDACINSINCSIENLPLKNCSSDNLIIIKEPVKSDKERINQEGKCIFISANLENQTIYTDAFLFKILGIN